MAALILFVLHSSRFATAESLEYRAPPPDNPLRGLVPYVSAHAKDRFPHSMEFRYFAWSELMKGPAQFDWAPIEKTLNEVQQRGNQLIFRVYCEYPGNEPAIPAFLLDAGIEVSQWTNHSDGQISHTPDYEDEALREALAAFIKALGARYDADPRIAFITAGLLGSWGEWHTHPREDLWASKRVQREVMESFAAAFSETKVLLRYPAGPDTFLHAANHERPFGYHDDSFAWATLDTGKKSDAWYFEPSIKAAGATEKWKTFPIGGEIRPELWETAFTPNRHPRNQGFVECVEAVKASWLMDTGLFDPRFPMDRKRRETALRETARLGYALHVSKAEWHDETVSLTIENRGVAPFYYDWPVEVEIDGKVQTTDWKLSEILPARPQNWSIQHPATGKLKLRVPNPMKGGKPLRFANRNQGEEWLVVYKK